MNASLDVVCNFINTNLRILVMRKLLCHSAIALFPFYETCRSPSLKFSSIELIFSIKEYSNFEYFEFKVPQIFGVKSNLLIPAD